MSNRFRHAALLLIDVINDLDFSGSDELVRRVAHCVKDNVPGREIARIRPFTSRRSIYF